MSYWSEEMTKSNAINEISSIANHLPFDVLQDIKHRIGDWLESGGNEI